MAFAIVLVTPIVQWFLFRVMRSHGVSVTLWAGKRRLALMKTFWIARRELLSCLLLSKLIVMIVKAVEGEVKVNKVFCWSDS